ncbi:MAG: alanine racemase [Holophagales bacterium]|nr:alanine racemase [Holophagales bacterium]MBK9964457.1 alanine racemase [Holophagales bacterium]
MSLLYATHARVHLGNIRDNLRAIRAAVGPERKVLVAVKANGYGHGAVEVSRMAEATGTADWLGVATVPEGLQLREAGLRLPILKLGPTFPWEMRAAVEAGLTLAVCSREEAEALGEAVRDANRPASVHLKVDTGMGRVGVSVAEAPALARFVVGLPGVVLEGVFTHLPVSDAADATFTREQILRFRTTAGLVQEAAMRRLLVHCANSGAILGHESSWLDLVRPGIMVYGFRPDPESPATIPLKPGMSLLTRVSFVKKVARGTSVGYGRTWVAPADTTIATIPAGYADGFNRLFSNRGRVLIDGRSFPVVGRVCMDQSMVDLGPGTDVKVGDEVVLMGRSGELEISCEEWAEKLGTITYEVTCQVNSRVVRLHDPY